MSMSMFILNDMKEERKRKKLKMKKLYSYNKKDIYAIYMYIIRKITRLKYYTTLATYIFA